MGEMVRYGVLPNPYTPGVLVDFYGNPVVPGLSGAYVPTNVPPPSGDTSGATDLANLTAAANALSAANGGDLRLAPGIYYVNGALPLSSGVSWIGSGGGATTVKAASGYTGHLFSVTVPAGGTLTSVHMQDLTLDGRTVGANHCVHVDMSANANIRYHDVIFERVICQNAYAGWWLAANNASSGIADDSILVSKSRAVSCSIGILEGGTYGLTVDMFSAIGCTIAGITNGAIIVTAIGAGPTAYATLRNIYVQGLNNVTNSSTTERGIAFGSSSGYLNNININGISGNYALQYSTGEGFGAIIDGVYIYSCAGTGIELLGGSATDMGLLTNFVVSQCGENASLTATTLRVAVAVDAGWWSLRNGSIGLSTTTMTYALEVGAASGAATAIVDGFNSNAAPITGFLYVNPGNTGSIIITNCEGAGVYNGTLATGVGTGASGAITLAVPALAAAMFSHLRVRAVGKVGAGNGNWGVQFNGDGGTHYDMIGTRVGLGTTTPAGGQAIAGTSWNATTVASGNDMPGSNNTSSGTFDLVIPLFAGNLEKTGQWRSGYNDSQMAAGYACLVEMECLWRSTAAITSILVFCNGTTFNVGTEVFLYGLP